MSPRTRNALRSILNALGLISFVAAAFASLVLLTDLGGMITPAGQWTHFGIPIGLFVLSWLLQQLGRRLR
jgi:hypothetical protein